MAHQGGALGANHEKTNGVHPFKAQLCWKMNIDLLSSLGLCHELERKSFASLGSRSTGSQD